ncbi:MAG TPA: 2-amino-4-hydroxy-6-hydroxymethyldihydropteridine diphosphokinase [Gemmatimonadota bacterium]|nr:2-amino-4-hydroxy-6-hydroxymethyldihydropteridine diphosphokinase [Gemmatimonadota bacterium]
MTEPVSPPAERVAIGMGSNLGDPLTNLRFGLRALRRLIGDVDASPVYETVPLHVADQPSFLNACCVGWTVLSPHELLTELQEIEALAGRVRRGRRYGPRTLDLDLLLYGSRVIHKRDIVVPHPRFRERAFVLVPLRDIAPDWRVPGDDTAPEGSVAELAEVVEAKGIVRTDFRLEDE